MTKTSRKTSRKPHAKTKKDPRFNGMADYVGIPQQFALPKAFQLNPGPQGYEDNEYIISVCFSIS